LFDSFLFLFNKPQWVSFSQLSASFLYKISQKAVRGQSGVHVNYLNVIFTGNMRDTHQGRELDALWPPLPYHTPNQDPTHHRIPSISHGLKNI